MSDYAPLPPSVRDALTRIEPSRDGDRLIFPCRATLADGSIVNHVCLVPAAQFAKVWEMAPSIYRDKTSIGAEDLAAIEESPDRLPARFANEIYKQGESGMGYTIFTVVFKDGSRQVYATGGRADFIPYPEGKGPSDVVSVIPHEGRHDPSLLGAPESLWCLFAEDPI